MKECRGNLFMCLAKQMVGGTRDSRLNDQVSYAGKIILRNWSFWSAFGRADIAGEDTKKNVIIASNCLLQILFERALPKTCFCLQLLWCSYSHTRESITSPSIDCESYLLSLGATAETRAARAPQDRWSFCRAVAY